MKRFAVLIATLVTLAIGVSFATWRVFVPLNVNLRTSALFLEVSDAVATETGGYANLILHLTGTNMLGCLEPHPELVTGNVKSVTFNPDSFLVTRHNDETAYQIGVIGNLEQAEVENLAASFVTVTQITDPEDCAGGDVSWGETEPEVLDATVFVSDMPAGAASLPISDAQAGTTIDWGDGQVQTLTASATGVSHIYDAAGVYTITITGPHTGIWNDTITTTFGLRLVEVRQIASTVTNLNSLFYCGSSGCSNLSSNAMGYLENWDTSKVTDMQWMFYSTFKGATNPPALPIGNWNTSNVTMMDYMFYATYKGATNPPALPEGIGNWTPNVDNRISYMFYGTYYGATWPDSAKPSSGPDLHCWAVPGISASAKPPFDTDFGLTWDTTLQPSWGAAYPVCGGGPQSAPAQLPPLVESEPPVREEPDPEELVIESEKVVIPEVVKIIPVEPDLLEEDSPPPPRLEVEDSKLPAEPAEDEIVGVGETPD